MKRARRKFPPNSLRDLDKTSAENFLSLLRQTRQFRITLFLGSGVSASAGLPIWNQLLMRICTAFFDTCESRLTRKGKGSIQSLPSTLPVPFFCEFTSSGNAVSLATEFAKGDPTLVAQQIKNLIRQENWLYLLHKVLYGQDFQPKESQLSDAIALLCSKPGIVDAVVNYNYDNLLETYLKRRNLAFTVVFEGKSHLKKNSLPIDHPHGYMRDRGGPKTKIILAESDYHRESAEPYSWGNLIQTKALCNSCCVFIGVSMTDPNLRRLLRATLGIHRGKHFAFLPARRHRRLQAQMYRALFDRDITELGVLPIRYPVKSSLPDPYARLPALIDLMTKGILDEEAIW